MEMIKNTLKLLLFAVLAIYGFTTIAKLAEGPSENQIAVGDP